MAAGDHPPIYDAHFFLRRSYSVCKKQASSSWRLLVLSSHPSKSDFLYTLCYKIPSLLYFKPNKNKSLDYKGVFIIWSILIKVREIHTCTCKHLCRYGAVSNRDGMFWGSKAPRSLEWTGLVSVKIWWLCCLAFL